jgi:hypothetical protein
VLGVAALVALFGYSVLYYGLDQIGGGNNGFWSLVIPGKYSNQPKDTPDKDWSTKGTATTGNGGGTATTPPSQGGSWTWVDSNGNPIPPGTPGGHWKVAGG